MNKQRYTSRLRKRPSWPLLVAIVLFHIAVFYGLARALAPDFTASVERDVVSAFTVTITAPPEPPPPENRPEPDEGAQGDPGEEAVPQPVTAPSPRIERQPQPRPRASSTGTASRSGARESGEGTGAAGSGDGTGSGNRGSGQGGIAVTRPSVRSGSLDTASDFPVPPGGRQSRFGKSVTVAFTVTTDGRARNCSVARSGVDPETTSLVCG
ncbi:MAG: hypothetical protein QNJ15_13755, partial [Erythrobacter sp.]|nr:hypothetical protein [Erythrobacter sp.]